jgi:hypothetical protein
LKPDTTILKPDTTILEVGTDLSVQEELSETSYGRVWGSNSQRLAATRNHKPNTIAPQAGRKSEG